MNYQSARDVLFKLDPETAHGLALEALRLGSSLGFTRNMFEQVHAPRKVMGLEFPNAVGLAAGYDKNARFIDGLGDFGFGFIEVGTITPVSQEGNPRPRIFRIPEASAVINRMGFPSVGLDATLKNLKKGHRYKGILGINIGKNKVTPLENAYIDYVLSMQAVFSYADYITINISSPNTPGLRDMQSPEFLAKFLGYIRAEQMRLSEVHNKYVPVLVKLAPDIAYEDLSAVANAIIQGKMDGIIATNTTISRVGVEQYSTAKETGGLSGKPLTAKSLDFVRTLCSYVNGAIPVIGCGGIMTPEDGKAMIDAGASLVQIYTGLIYNGPQFVSQLAKQIS